MRTYQESLRRARGEIFRHQETLRRAALDERSAALRQARVRANEAIQEAKGRIRSEIEAARTELDSSTVQLAEQIARTILQPEVQMNPRQAGEV
jgi:F0F1-type ATP synthase membrane subunit b/b'